jgi:ubiquinone/menaquinone biosynthesis C-methylase UbiE
MRHFDFDAGDLAERYDRGRELPSETMQLWMDELASHMPAGLSRVLDLGCGTGRFTAPLSRRLAVPVYGVDVSRRMLAVAAGTLAGSSGTLIQATAGKLPFRDASFDAALLSMVLHHIRLVPHATVELARVVRPAGILLIRTATIEIMSSYLWARFFPEGTTMEAARLLRADEIPPLVPGFALRVHRVIPQQFASDPSDYCHKISERALSSLRAIPNAAFAAGLAALQRHCAAAPQEPIYEDVDLFIFERTAAA